MSDEARAQASRGHSWLIMDGDLVAYTDGEAWVYRPEAARGPAWRELNSAEAALKGVRATNAVMSARFGSIPPLPSEAFRTFEQVIVGNKKLIN